jgi:hypothetical protein
MRSNSFAALGSAEAGASPSSIAVAPLDAAEQGSPPRGAGGFGGDASASASASLTSSARRRRRSRAASTPAEDVIAGSSSLPQSSQLLDAASLSFRFASERETDGSALGGSANRLLKSTSIDRAAVALGIDANSVERSSESAGSLTPLTDIGGGSAARTSSGVLSDGGGSGGSQHQAGARPQQQRSMVPLLPTIAASPLGPSSLSSSSAASAQQQQQQQQQRPCSSPTKNRGGSATAATATATAAASAAAANNNPFDGFVTPRGSPWAPAPLEAAAEGGSGGGAGATKGGEPRSARNSGGGGGSSSAPPPPPPHQISSSSSSSFRSYLHGELHPNPSLPTADVAWGQTERQRVYNALLAVPLHLERLLLLGGLLCTDAWLAVLTLLPLRIGMAVAGGGRWLFTRRRRRGGGKKKKEKMEEVDNDATEEEAPSKSNSPSSSSNPGALLYDLLSLLIFAAAALTCCAVPVGALYFWMKDMTQEFLKLHVIYTAVDILDKIACSFSVDALDALAGTCALIAAAPSSPRRTRKKSEREAAANEAASTSASASAALLRTPLSSSANASSSSSAPPSPSRLSFVPHLLADSLVAGAIVTAHAFILLAHGVALSVAMHSKRGSTLLALTFASNFVEIKSAVFKRYDGRKLYTLACQDCVERFHLLAALAFVLVEAAAAGKGGSGGGGGSAAEPSSSSSSSYSFWSRPDALLLTRCGHVFAAEVVIDVIKHAVLSKFNEVRPGMYREFARDVASAAADGRRGHSHLLYRRLLFDPLAPAALVVRMLVTAARARRRQAIAAAVTAANAAGGAEALSEAVVAAATSASGSSSAAGAMMSLLSAACSWLFSFASSVAGWLLLWLCVLGCKIALGFGLRVGCAAYLKHYDRRHGGPQKRE